MTTKYGVPEKTLALIISVFSGYPTVQWLKIYGSRAKGDYRTGSDIDLAYLDVDEKDLSGHFLTELDELPTPYLFDVTNYQKISNQDLKEHIDRVGKLIWKR